MFFITIFFDNKILCKVKINIFYKKSREKKESRLVLSKKRGCAIIWTPLFLIIPVLRNSISSIVYSHSGLVYK